METPRVPCILRSEDKLALTCNAYSLGVVLSESPLSSSFDYFEITLENPGDQKIVTIGLAHQGYSRTRQPGWDRGSIGYHGDDGKLFYLSSPRASFPTYMEPGDVVGCGVNAANMIYFTKNGAIVGSPVPNPLEGTTLYFAIGIRSAGAKVVANVGGSPFKYVKRKRDPSLKGPRLEFPEAANAEISDDLLSLSSTSADCCVVLSDVFMSKRTFDYFEMTVESSGDKEFVAIGVVHQGYARRGRMPGWDANSVGYHCDDGKLFYQRNFGQKFGPTYLDGGDVVGCGFDSSGEIFFTKNGELVGSPVPSPFRDMRVFAAVGMKSSGARLTTNFGQLPFKYAKKNKEPLPTIGTVAKSPNHEHPMTFGTAPFGRYPYVICDGCGKESRDQDEGNYAWRSINGANDFCLSCFKTKFVIASMELNIISKKNDSYYCVVKKLEANSTTQRLTVHIESHGDGSEGYIPSISHQEVRETSGTPVEILSEGWYAQDHRRMMGGVLIYDLSKFKKGKSYVFQYASNPCGYSCVPLFTLNDRFIKSLQLDTIFPLGNIKQVDYQRLTEVEINPSKSLQTINGVDSEEDACRITLERGAPAFVYIPTSKTLYLKSAPTVMVAIPSQEVSVVSGILDPLYWIQTSQDVGNSVKLYQLGLNFGKDPFGDCRADSEAHAREIALKQGADGFVYKSSDRGCWLKKAPLVFHFSSDIVSGVVVQGFNVRMQTFTAQMKSPNLLVHGDLGLESTPLFGGYHLDTETFDDLLEIESKDASSLRVLKINVWSSEDAVHGVQTFFKATAPTGEHSVRSTGQHRSSLEGSNMTSIVLWSDEHVARVEGTHSEIVNYLVIELSNGTRYEFGDKQSGHTPFVFTPPPGKSIVGFLGSFGKSLYQIGAVYATGPVPFELDLKRSPRYCGYHGDSINFDWAPMIREFQTKLPFSHIRVSKIRLWSKHTGQYVAIQMCYQITQPTGELLEFWTDQSKGSGFFKEVELSPDEYICEISGRYSSVIEYLLIIISNKDGQKVSKIEQGRRDGYNTLSIQAPAGKCVLGLVGSHNADYFLHNIGGIFANLRPTKKDENGPKSHEQLCCEESLSDKKRLEGCKGPIFIQNLRSGLYCTFNPSTMAITQYHANYSKNQQFIWNRDDSISPASRPDLTLDVDGDRPTIVARPKKTGENTTLAWASPFLYMAHGIVVDVQASSVDPGARIIVAPKDDEVGESQQFALYSARVKLERLKLEGEQVIKRCAEDGPFFIESITSGLFLDTAGFSFLPNTRIVQFAIHCGQSQQWVFNADYTISPLGQPEVVLDIQSGAINRLILSARTGEPTQLFSVEDRFITSRSAGLVLEVFGNSKEPGTNVIVSNKDGNVSQQFRLHNVKREIERRLKEAEEAIRALANDGPFLIESMQSGLYLDAKGGFFEPETRLIQYTTHGGLNQQWVFNEDRTISPYDHPEVVLDISGEESETAGQVVLNAPSGEAKQKFRLEEGCVLVNDTGLVLEVHDWSKEPGAHILAAKKHGDINQQFKFHSVRELSAALEEEEDALWIRETVAEAVRNVCSRPI